MKIEHNQIGILQVIVRGFQVHFEFNDMSTVIPINAPEIHRACLDARWEILQNAMLDLEKREGSKKAQYFRQLKETTWIALTSLFELDAVRSKHPSNHAPETGISEYGQLEIYRSTIEFHNAMYLLLNGMADVVNGYPKTFQNAGTSSVTKFMQWLVMEEAHKFTVQNAILPSHSFRTIVNHPQQTNSLSWETHTRGGGPVYIVLTGMGDPKAGFPTEAATFPKGPGWAMASPEECLTAILILDLLRWILEGIHDSIYASVPLGDRSWSASGPKELSELVKLDSGFIAMEFRRSLGGIIDLGTYLETSAFD